MVQHYLVIVGLHEHRPLLAQLMRSVGRSLRGACKHNVHPRAGGTSPPSKARPASLNPAQMSSSFIHDPEHWRGRAEEMRRLAEDMKDAATKERMVRIARDYENLPMRAEERSRSPKVYRPAYECPKCGHFNERVGHAGAP